MKVYLILIIILTLISISFQEEDLIGLPRVKDEKDHHDFIYLHPIKKDNLTNLLKKRNLYDSNSTKVSSPNIITTPIDKRYISKLNEQQVKDYYQWIALKNSFELQNDQLKNFTYPFQIENPDYHKIIRWNAGIPFFGLAVIIGGLIIIFLILRLGFKKCIGPTTLKQITRSYRNISWILFALSLVGIIICSIYIILYNTKLNAKVKTTIAKWTNDTILIANDKLYSFGNMTNYLKGNNTYNISESITKDLNDGLNNYKSQKNSHYQRLEKTSNILFSINWTLISIYFAVTITTFYAFFKRNSKLILFFSFLVLITLPLICILNGFYMTYFFQLGDFCEAIYNSIYMENFFPINNVSIGNFISCFDAKTRSAAYSLRYSFFLANKYILNNLSNTNNTDPKKYKLLSSDMNVTLPILESIINCSHVFSGVTFAEEILCAEGENTVWYLIQYFLYLLISVFFFGVAINKLKPLIEKKKLEIESMMLNEDIE